MDVLLSMLPYYVLSVAFWGTAIDIAGEIAQRARPRRHIWRVGSFVLLGVAFALLAISAGPAPAVQRAEVTIIVRWLCLLAGLALMGSLGMKWKAALRRTRRRMADA